jgi:uroporphyrinogen decarboxylase
MRPRDRVQAALRHAPVDRVPRFEIWIDAFIDELGGGDPAAAYVDQGQDGILMPTRAQLSASAATDGTDEWGRIWRQGDYVGGAVDVDADILRYSPPLETAAGLFDRERIVAVRSRYPDHVLFYGSHIGPFTAAYLAMGFDRFFLRLADDRAFVEKLIAARTEWCQAVFAKAVDLGAEILILGEDAAHRDGPMVSPRLWRDLVLPHLRRIVETATVPVLWHSDGDVRPLLAMAVEAGFTGVHGLDPSAGIDLERVKKNFGSDLVLVGNVDSRVLCGSDLPAVRAEVARGLSQGAPGGGFMLASCNSIFAGMNPAAVSAYFACQAGPDEDIVRFG